MEYLQLHLVDRSLKIEAMSFRRASMPGKHLFCGFTFYQPVTRAGQRCLIRYMATEAPSQPVPNATISRTYIDADLHSAPSKPILEDRPTIPPPGSPAPSPPQPHRRARNPFITTATCTLHAFPSLEPTRFVTYPSTHLLVPLRKDILHRAVIYEGDRTRQGTASTKWRSEVHGSNRKIRPQKGTGKARLGDKKSPMLKGGGVSFGPKPRDFSTDLPRKIYDLAWRTALSYRYRKGELLLVDDVAELDVHNYSAARYLRDMLRWNRMGHSDGRTLFITGTGRERLFDALHEENMGREAVARKARDVDVKDLLELGWVIIERSALDWLLGEHESDLVPSQRFGRLRRELETETGREMVVHAA